jgi:TPR repeat protein
MDSDGHYNAGMQCFQRGEHTAAAEHCQLGCDEGDATSQLRLGMLYHAGAGVARDPAKAAALWHLAAEQGNALAECNLGAVYCIGDGVPRDVTKAEMYYERAAEPSKRCFEAQYGLGCIKFTRGDEAKALALFEQAAAGGVYDAQWNAGMMHRDGRGTSAQSAQRAQRAQRAQMAQRAAVYFKMAADQGTPSALLNMAFIYYEGAGVRRDRAKAVEYFKSAADKGNAKAQWNVATLYKHGDGVARNPALASWYFARAAEQGITSPPDGPAYEPPKRKGP